MEVYTFFVLVSVISGALSLVAIVVRASDQLVSRGSKWRQEMVREAIGKVSQLPFSLTNQFMFLSLLCFR